MTVEIRYEFPLNERIRTFLRLENTFSKMAHFSDAATSQDHHAVLVALFDVLEIAARTDLKVDLVQELERQRQFLLSLKGNPGVSSQALADTLYEIEQAWVTLLAANGKIGQHLRDNEWLMSVRSRCSIPGGTCEFDLPSYHHWLHLPAQQRNDDILYWVEPLRPAQQALSILLRLLRGSGHHEPKLAEKGQFQFNISDRTAQLLRMELDENLAVFPQVCANKYALSIRFMGVTTAERARIVSDDIPFGLAFCAL